MALICIVERYCFADIDAIVYEIDITINIKGQSFTAAESAIEHQHGPDTEAVRLGKLVHDVALPWFDCPVRSGRAFWNFYGRGIRGPGDNAIINCGRKEAFDG